MIYWVRSGDTELVKVGYAVSVSRRLVLLQCGNPFPLTLLRAEPGDRDLEGALHRHYAPHKTRREWFKLSDEAVAVDLSCIQTRPPRASSDSQAGYIIGLLGGMKIASQIVGAPLTTVQSWRDGGFIPARRQQGIIEAAGRAGIEITPQDFFRSREAA